MTYESWLGRDWEEVRRLAEETGKGVVVQVTQPRGKIETFGSYRVVRLREFPDRLELVLAQEKFSRI